MSSNDNELSSLIKQLSRVKVNGQDINRQLTPTNLLNQSSDGLQRSDGNPPSTTSLGEMNSLSLNAKKDVVGISFGSPSSRGTSSTQNGSEWASLLKKTTGGSGSSLLGSFGLGSIGGLGSIVSGIAGLFGGGDKKKTLPPLVDFQLPTSQSETIYVGANRNNANQGLGSEAAIPFNGRTTADSSMSTSNAEWIQAQSSQIAQAVKTALLNSNSLNDVISEI